MIKAGSKLRVGDLKRIIGQYGDEEFDVDKGKGESKEIEFEDEFDSTPNVSAVPGHSRLSVSVSEMDKKGFRLIASNWTDEDVEGATVYWHASEKS